MSEVVLTGDRPTGPLHLGHYVGSIVNRLSMQERYRQFIIIADMQALTDNFDEPHSIKKNIIEVTLDYLACGIDPSKTVIFIQSHVPQIAELTMYYLNLVTVARLERNPTVKEELKEKKFEKRVPAGFLMYPVSQAADITAFKAKYVPVGADQLPMIEQTQEIVRTFNRIYKTDILVEPEAILSDVKRLPGIDGKAKMSKSLGNAIFLSDEPDVVQKKVMKMYTDPKRIHANIPGNVEGNPVFIYLDAFDRDKHGLEELKTKYRHGGVGDVEVKKRLIEVLNGFLEPIRKRRKEISHEYVMKVLKEGTQCAVEVAEKTLKEVRKAIGLISI